MNWNLILSLSCLGVAMGIASVLGWTGGLELYLWLGIYLFCAVWIARRSARRRFLHGFMTGLIAGGLASLVQSLLFSTYIAHNPQVAQNFKQIPGGIPPRLFFLVLAPVVGAVSGVGVGLLAWIAGKTIRERS